MRRRGDQRRCRRRDTRRAAGRRRLGVSVTVSPSIAYAWTQARAAEFTITFTNLGDAGPAGSLECRFPDLVERRHPGDEPDCGVTGPYRCAGRPSGAGETTGSTTFDVEFGYNGAYTAQVSALVAPLTVTGLVTDDPLNLYTLQRDDSALPDHVRRWRVTVPSGTRYLRVALASLDEGSTDDLDLYLQCPDGECPDGDRGAGERHRGALRDHRHPARPPAGEYVIDVHGYQTDDVVGGPGANFEAGMWAIGDSGGAGALLRAGSARPPPRSAQLAEVHGRLAGARSRPALPGARRPQRRRGRDSPRPWSRSPRLERCLSGVSGAGLNISTFACES